jgi:hypothetical protein
MEPDEQTARDADPGSDSLSYPNAMKARTELRIGDRTVVMVTARTTPAGLVSVGVMVTAILLSVAVLVHIARRKL